MAQPEWRRDEENRPLGLFITSGGLLALGVDDTEKTNAFTGGGKHSTPAQDGSRTAAREGSEGFARQPQAASSAFAKQAGSGDPDASAAIRRHHR